MIRALVVAVLLALPLAGGTAAAEPRCTSAPCRVKSSSTLKTEKGSEVSLPPGWFMSDAVFSKVDAETRRLQDAETRLAAENASLRKSAAEAPFGWGTIAIVVSAFAAGAALPAIF